VSEEGGGEGERGEGLINGRRHAPESIAGREGRKSGETAGGKHRTTAEGRRRKRRSNEKRRCTRVQQDRDRDRERERERVGRLEP